VLRATREMAIIQTIRKIFLDLVLINNMLAKKRKNKKSDQTVLFSVVFILLFFTITGFLVFSNWKINQKRSDLDAKIESLRNKFKK